MSCKIVDENLVGALELLKAGDYSSIMGDFSICSRGRHCGHGATIQQTMDRL